jgi:hypothetical protein
MPTVDVLIVNLENQTAYCTDGITRPFHQMFDAEAQLTTNPEEAVVATVQISDGDYVIVNLVEKYPIQFH